MGWFFQIIDSTLLIIWVINELWTFSMISLEWGLVCAIIDIKTTWFPYDEVVVIFNVRTRLGLVWAWYHNIIAIIVPSWTYWSNLLDLLLEIWVIPEHISKVVICDPLLILLDKAAFLYWFCHSWGFRTYQVLQINTLLLRLHTISILWGPTMCQYIGIRSRTCELSKTLPDLAWTRLLWVINWFYQVLCAFTSRFMCSNWKTESQFPSKSFLIEMELFDIWIEAIITEQDKNVEFTYFLLCYIWLY